MEPVSSVRGGDELENAVDVEVLIGDRCSGITDAKVLVSRAVARIASSELCQNTTIPSADTVVSVVNVPMQSSCKYVIVSQRL